MLPMKKRSGKRLCYQVTWDAPDPSQLAPPAEAGTNVVIQHSPTGKYLGLEVCINQYLHINLRECLGLITTCSLLIAIIQLD